MTVRVNINERFKCAWLLKHATIYNFTFSPGSFVGSRDLFQSFKHFGTFDHLTGKEIKVRRSKVYSR